MRRFLYQNIFCLLLLWLCIGIAAEWYCGLGYLGAAIALLSGCILLFISALRHTTGRWHRAVTDTTTGAERARTYGAGLVLISIGIAVTTSHLPSATNAEISAGKLCSGVVKEIRATPYGTRMEVQLTAVSTQDEKQTPIRNVDVYLTADSAALHPGDMIAWRNRLTPIAATGNRQDDVWPEVLRLQGVLYRQHILPPDYQIVDSKRSFSVAMAEARARHRKLLANSRLNEPAAALTTAIITGDRQALSTSTMEDFRLTGLSHILALSGLHIGMSASLLLFALMPLHLLRRIGIHKARWVIASVLLWGYAAYTGLSAPVVRACIMSTALLLGATAERPYRAGNTLAVAALVVLLCDPLQLFQAGFQLSFLITALILAAIRRINVDFKGRKRLLLNVCRTLLLALAAMIGSWLLTAYHFHTLSVGSLPWNLLVSMVLPVYFIAAVLYSLMLSTGCDPLWAAAVVDGLAEAVLWCGNHPEASIPVWLNGVAALTLGIALAAFMTWLHIHRRKWLIASATAFVIAVGCVVYLPSGKPKDGFIVQDYAVRHTGTLRLNPIRIYADGRDSLLLLPDDTTMLLTIHGQRLLLLNSPRLPACNVDCKLLLVGAGYTYTPDLTHISPDTILLLPDYATAQWLDTTLAMPPVLSLRDNGPYPSFRAM